MPTYIMILRAVNVARTTIKMESLRQWLTELGLRQVRTYIQSGNALFDSDLAPPACIQAVEAKLAAEMGAPVAVLLTTPAELARVIAGNPFVKDAAIDRSKLHVTFLGQTPTTAALERLRQVQAAPDEFRSSGAVLYVHCPQGYGRTKLSNQAIERALGVKATTRNWNTVNKLSELAQGSSATGATAEATG